MSKFQPGKRRILNSLKKGRKRFEKLHADTKLNRNYLNDYLKEMQINGLVGKDIITHEFFIEPVSYASLVFSDIIDFLREYLTKLPNISDNYVLSTERSLHYFWLYTMDNSIDRKLRSEILEKLENNLEIKAALGKISTFIENIYDSYILSTYAKNEKNIIKKYDRTLCELANLLQVSNSNNIPEPYAQESLLIAELKLKQQFPGVTIPKEMIELEANRENKSLVESHNMINHPVDLVGLKKKIDLLSAQSRLRLSFNNSEQKVIEEKIIFIEKRSNRKLYETYLKRLRDRPKTLLMYPSLGFDDPLIKLRQKYPKIIQTQVERQIINDLKSNLDSFSDNFKAMRKNYIKNIAKSEGLSVQEVENQINKIKERKKD